jgi:hypothetical protein
MSTPLIPPYGSGEYGSDPIENLPLGYYLGLLSSQYRNSPKWNAFLALMLQKLEDASICLVQMEEAFDLDNALGVQLDAIGTIVGASRTLPFQPTGGLSPVLGDDDYRVYLKSKAAQNQWDGTIDGLQVVWEALFAGGLIVIFDHENMSATIFLTGSFSPIMQQMIVNGLIVPRPQAVQYNYAFNLPAFGFDLNNTYIAGFDVGKMI